MKNNKKKWNLWENSFYLSEFFFLLIWFFDEKFIFFIINKIFYKEICTIMIFFIICSKFSIICKKMFIFFHFNEKNCIFNFVCIFYVLFYCLNRFKLLFEKLKMIDKNLKFISNLFIVIFLTLISVPVLLIYSVFFNSLLNYVKSISDYKIWGIKVIFFSGFLKELLCFFKVW